MRLVPQRSDRPEILDRPDNPAVALEGALRDIRLTNRWLGGRRALALALRPFLAAGSAPLEVLDIGTGAADLPLEMVRLGRLHGRAVRVTALDRDPRIAALAGAATRDREGVRVVCGDARRPPFAERSFDLVTASMFLHHFPLDEVTDLLRRFRGLAREAVLVNDLRRHVLPWAFIRVAARLTRRHPMYAHDAPLSVLRGFTVAELERAAARAGARGARVEARWPYRLVVTLGAGEER